MTRTCTVCQHPQREAIDKALVATSDPYRDIAGQFGLSRSALVRHKADHLLEAIRLAWQEERNRNGRELADQLEDRMARVQMLLDACHDFLTDPDDSGRYTLGPRTWETVIHSTEDRGEDGRPVRRKMKLSEALALVDGKPGIGAITLVEAKFGDPRKLIIDAAKQLESSLRLLGEIVGKLQTQGTTNFLATPEWAALERRMLAALGPYPAARLALAEALEEGGGGNAD